MSGRRWLPIAGLATILAAWGLAVVVFRVPAYIVPSPFEVIATIWRDADTLLANLWPTAIESLAGFLLGNLASVLIAIAFVQRRTLEQAFFPIAVVVNTIPIVAIAPILVLLFGNDMKPKIAIAALICFFPTLVNMVRGLSAVNPSALELMRVLAASDREVLFKLRLPNSLPYLFASLRIATSTAVIGAIVGEWVGSTSGLGALIIRATYNFDTPLLYAAVTVASAFSVSFFLVVGWLEKKLLTWEPGSS